MFPCPRARSARLIAVLVAGRLRVPTTAHTCARDTQHAQLKYTAHAHAQLRLPNNRYFANDPKHQKQNQRYSSLEMLGKKIVKTMAQKQHSLEHKMKYLSQQLSLVDQEPLHNPVVSAALWNRQRHRRIRALEQELALREPFRPTRDMTAPLFLGRNPKVVARADFQVRVTIGVKVHNHRVIEK